ncbi:cytochrome P460 family protein [Sulfuriflexus mobilis]|uniref:cytochrome P460 family protein n=1 Tax=Sulfuriflexus mobilis TaxID=1811807 RepID=UPI000F821946|nr:cytochrome P460 family protein [Sulfuriflexus mobilis]
MKNISINTTRSALLWMSLSLLSQLFFAGNVFAGEGFARFNNNDELIRPTGYREWIYIGAPLTPNDMNNGKAAFPEFHNVYIDPDGWKHWKKTGEFKDGTLIIKELVSVGTKSSSSGKGYFMGEYIGLEAVLKDKNRFPASDKHWGFFRFTTDDHTKLLKGSRVAPSQSCAACHKANAEQDAIFTQHYPVLRAAKGRGEQGTGGK